MKYRIVLSLPFNILLVHRVDFTDSKAAWTYQQEHYPAFPGLEVWPQEHVTAWKGLTVIFPVGILNPTFRMQNSQFREQMFRS